MDSNYQPRSPQHVVLAMLMNADVHVDRLYDRASLVSVSKPRFNVDVISPMVVNGDLRQHTGSKIYGITNKGAEIYMQLQDQRPVYLDSNMANKRTIKHNSMRDRPDYDGKELDQLCMRPGAYDFLKYPSLIQGVRYYRKDAPQ